MAHLSLEFCNVCRQLKNSDLGRFFNKTRRCHDRRWICYNCLGKPLLAKLNFKISPLEREAREALLAGPYRFVEEFQFASCKLRYDFAVPALRLILELDSKRWHDHPSRRARDRRKDLIARQGGYEVARISTKQAESVGFLVNQAMVRREAELGARPDY